MDGKKREFVSKFHRKLLDKFQLNVEFPYLTLICLCFMNDFENDRISDFIS